MGGDGGLPGLLNRCSVVNIFNLIVRLVSEKEAASHSWSKMLSDRLTWCDSAMYLQLHHGSQLITSVASVLFSKYILCQCRVCISAFIYEGTSIACIHGFFFLDPNRVASHFGPNMWTHWPTSQHGNKRLKVIRFAWYVHWWLHGCTRSSAAVLAHCLSESLAKLPLQISLQEIDKLTQTVIIKISKRWRLSSQEVTNEEGIIQQLCYTSSTKTKAKWK